MSELKGQKPHSLNGQVQPESNLDCPVMAVLRGAAHGGLRDVKCEVREGTAVLQGRVQTFYLKQLAQELVKNVETVERVVNQLIVGYQ